MVKKALSIVILLAFVANSVMPAYAQGVLPGAGELSEPGSMMALSPSINPPMLKGIKVYANDPFRFDFIMDNGKADLKEGDLRLESDKLIKYFLASLTVPEKDLWVNLSPYEKDRIIPNEFGQTEMGRDLLAQDYMLKQVTASLLYPDGNTGKEFWAEVYKQAYAQYGTADIPVDTFNKVWIIPEKAVVYEKQAVAYVVESRLKVMLEGDYLATSQSDAPQDRVVGGTTPARTSALTKNILRTIVIPVLEQEVNKGANFVKLRQVYNSLILAAWYKKKIKDSLLSKVYVDQKKVQGVNINDPQAAEKIWSQYVAAFKKGVVGLIREEKDAVSGEVIPRKYFSGGILLQLGAKIESAQSVPLNEILSEDRAMLVSARGQAVNNAMSMFERPISTASVGGDKIEYDLGGKKLVIYQEDGVVKGNYYVDFFVQQLPSIMEKLRKESSPLGSVLELGVGRGVLMNGLGILTDERTKLSGVDRNERAVALTRRNAAVNALADRVDIRVGTSFEPFMSEKKKFDLIVFDLPMIPVDREKYGNRLQENVFSIIDGGPDGRENIDKLARTSRDFLNEGGSIFFVQPDFLGEQKTIRAYREQGYDVEVIARQKKFLSETIFTNDNKEYIEKVGNYTFLKDEQGRYFFDMLVIHAKKSIGPVGSPQMNNAQARESAMKSAEKNAELTAALGSKTFQDDNGNFYSLELEEGTRHQERKIFLIKQAGIADPKANIVGFCQLRWKQSVNGARKGDVGVVIENIMINNVKNRQRGIYKNFLKVLPPQVQFILVKRIVNDVFIVKLAYKIMDAFEVQRFQDPALGRWKEEISRYRSLMEYYLETKVFSIHDYEKKVRLQHFIRFYHLLSLKYGKILPLVKDMVGDIPPFAVSAKDAGFLKNTFFVGMSNDKRFPVFSLLSRREFLVHHPDQKKGSPTDGGIDLNTARLELKTENSGGTMKLNIDLSQVQEWQNAQGIAPVIINIRPMNDLSKFLGINQ
ncbi:MAG: methyltransferase [Candidatus Omnitrophica bacterium]|nr:methyltransferase [Candidatus Omnitrophota bacterium]